MNYSIRDIARIIHAEHIPVGDEGIDNLLLDSRKVYSPGSSLFFALQGPRRDGHLFLPELFKKGVRFFVVTQKPAEEVFPGAVFLVIKDSLLALQQLAAYHRRQFQLPVIGITGSNGKTIVKEWLYQLLQTEYNIVRSPKSYNSQIGVPLSVWQISKEHNLGIFEAGISQPGEMDKLAGIIQPAIGILTNIGDAHQEGFTDQRQKLYEKLLLFADADVIIYNNDQEAIAEEVNKLKGTKFSWGSNNKSVVRIISRHSSNDQTTVRIAFRDSEADIVIPFTDEASVENALTVCTTLLYLGKAVDFIREKLLLLQPVNMRLELKKGINQCTIINDSYSSDLHSLDMALGFLDQQVGSNKKTVILSDLLQTGIPAEKLYALILDKLKEHRVERLIGIGEQISEVLYGTVSSNASSVSIELFDSTDSFLNQFRTSHFKDETILIKGARVFGFEQIARLLEQKVHQTLLEINLNAIVHNVKEYQKLLKPSTKIMAMVKAFAYGSGGAEIAGILQYHKVDYLGVAYTDEGVELRRAGITLPIMVMNPEESSFEALIDYHLEPEIYSFGLLQSFNEFLQREGLQACPVHIEIETGMNRLGFAPAEMDQLGQWLKSNSTMKVKSVFTHLAASEDPGMDDFTWQQHTIFSEAARTLSGIIEYPFDRHIANSAAILRHPSLQSDMIRLGIGMYGVDSSGSRKLALQTVATLKSTIAQLKRIKKGESVSYNRKGIVTRDSVIATVRIGYADGYSRRLGNGVGSMWVNGKLAPVIGTVCMDMTMLDVTDIAGVEEGDEVIVFGKHLPVQQVAAWAGTIPYEIMTGISQRVKRVYFEE